jgi:hypothetical protein
VWYRPDLKFVLEWNKYAFHPAVFLVAALALMAAASRWWIQVTLAAIVTLATFNGVFSAKRRSYDALIRHPGVLEMLSDFSQSFGALEGQKIALAEMKFRWPIFIQGSEPSLSLLFKAEPRLRSSEADFIEFNPSTSSARMSQFSNLLASSPAIRGFYAKYGGSLVLGAEGDGGTVTLSAGQVFVQEVSDPKDLGAYLKALELVIGYGDEARAGELELTIYDNQFSRLLSQTYSIASFTNNTPKRLDLSQPVYAIGGLFISIRLRGAGNSQQIAVYLAKNKSSQRGRFWDCRETPIASPWDNSSCVMSQSQIGVGVWRSDLPLS